jgi:hypothetical protein
MIHAQVLQPVFLEALCRYDMRDYFYYLVFLNDYSGRQVLEDRKHGFIDDD